MNKYEQLMEYIINDEEDKAKALFHNIVVERSRQIYESMLDEEDPAVRDDQVEGLVDEITADEHGMHEDDEEFGSEMGDDADAGMGDEPDMDMDMDMDDEHKEHEEIEDRVMGLEDAIDELKAEFNRLMGDESGDMDDESGDMDDESGDMGDEDGHDMDDMGDEAPMSGSGKMESKNPFAKSGSGSAASGKSGSGKSGSGKSGSGSAASGKKPMSEGERLREYVDKVSDGHGAEKKGAGEGTEIGTGGSVAVNKSGIVAKKNDMGGTTANIVKGGTNKVPDGTSPNKGESNIYKKGEGKFSNEKFQNTPGGDKKLSSAGKSYEKSHDSEGKQVGSGGTTPINKKSEIGGKVR